MEEKTKIIVIHGAGMHGGVFSGMVPHLLNYSLRPLDLPGHKTDGGLLTSIADMSAYIKKQLDGYANNSVVLMGHSMGALAAITAAGHQAVAALVLLGAAPEMPVNADLLVMAKDTPLEAIKMITKWSVYKDHPQADAVRTVVSSIMQSVDPRAIYNDLNACNEMKDTTVFVSRVTCPVLVIAGTDDKMTKSADSRKFMELFSNCEFVEIPACGHMMMVEQPIKISLEIKGFFKKHAL